MVTFALGKNARGSSRAECSKNRDRSLLLGIDSCFPADTLLLFFLPSTSDSDSPLSRGSRRHFGLTTRVSIRTLPVGEGVDSRMPKSLKGCQMERVPS